MNQAKLFLMTLVIGLALGNTAFAQSFPDTWKLHDLSQHGLPFSIMAPASATIEYDSDSDELWIEAESDSYRLMIANYEEKVESLVAEYKEEMEEDATYVIDEPNGFLVQVDMDGDVDFELYYAFTLKGKTYFAQTNPLSETYYTEEQATNIFHACKKAAGM